MLLRNQRRRAKVLLHVPLANDSIEVRPHALYRTLILRMDSLIRRIGILNVPRGVLKHAIGLPHVEQFFTHNTGGESALVCEAVTDCLD